VKFQITRIRLASVGPEAARYDPLDLDLRKHDHTGPADTVLFLPNTGGKTVLMRLLFSVLHPPVVERIGTEETAQRQKNLVGYVLERDSAHVAIEWRRVAEGRFADDEVLITGLVAEWRGGRPTGRAEDLIKLWYSIRGPMDVVGVDRLAFEAEAVVDGAAVRRRIPLKRFREELEESTRTGPRALKISTTHVQRDWVNHLDELGLDRALFRYQGEMNHNEAGASAIARFKEDRDFVKFFLDAVFDPDELAGLDREFDEVADKVRRFPEYERRLRFEQAALRELEPLAGIVISLAAARAEVEAARAAAMTLLSAFEAAEQIARAREAQERRRSQELDGEAGRLRVTADRYRDEWREFRRWKAILWVAEAKAAHQTTVARTAAAELDVRAWAVTEELVRLRQATAEAKALDDSYAAELERIRPLQVRRDEAATALTRHLLAGAVLASANAAAALSRAEAARQKATGVRKEETDARVEAAKLDAVREGNEQRLDEVATRRAALVEKNLLSAQERTEEARDRERSRGAEALARLASIEQESASLDAERGRVDEADRVAAPRLIELGEAHATASGEVDRAERERRELAAHPMIIELAEAAVFDLELVGPGVAERLLGRAKESDAARLRLELQGVADQRALKALEETGYLPPPPEVEVAVERLRAAGIPGALPGTLYVAEAVAPARRRAVLTRRPELVGGIVLTDAADLGRAEAILESAGLDPSIIIAVGRADALVAMEAYDSQPGTFVVPPSAALWDRTAGGTERARCAERVAGLDQERAALDAGATGARGLAEALVRHATMYPPGWLGMRIGQRDTLTAELDRLNRARADRDARRQDIGSALTKLRGEAGIQGRISREAELAAAELQRLADQEAATAGLPAAIERQRAEAATWLVLAEDSVRAAKSSDEDATRETATVHEHRAARERIERERSEVVLSVPVPEPSIEDAEGIASSGDLIELRARFEELDRRLAGETSASEIAARRDLAIRAREGLATTFLAHSRDVRERAAVLLAAPESGQLAGRRAAAERADEEAVRARTAEREAYAEHDRAKNDSLDVENEIRSSRRSAKIPDERVPRDRHQAALLAAEARESAESAQSKVATAERERDAARDEADKAARVADGLGGLATQLKMDLKLAEGTALPSVPPFEGDADEARKTGLSTGRRLRDATDGERTQENAWRAQDAAVRALLVQEEFSDLGAADHLYRRLAQSPMEVLARDVGELVSELQGCIGILQADLATLEEDRRLATTGLAKSAQKALSYLRLAETRSKMPPHLRDWSGEPFLEIRFDKPPAEELDVRLRTFVAEVLDPKSDRPRGSKLLMLALDRAVGQFRVRILKPNEGFLPTRVPVAELSSPSFSNGQRATVATALMLMLSELRRQSRSSARGASVGSLLLDNPLGNANAGFLIEVQRTVAAAAGIQLIYTTGIADLSALRRFSNVIALSNDAARRTMRRYVRADAAFLELLVPSEGGSGGRLSARRVVAITEHEAGT